MNNEPGIISIEGPIGVGKTVLSQKLSERLNAKLILEKVEENPFLSEFYLSGMRNAFQTQMFFLLSRYKQLQDISQQNLFQGKTVIDYLFDRDRVFAYINLNETEIRLYEEIYSLLKSKIPSPDLVIYLQADREVLRNRIRERARGFEQNISSTYIDEVCKAFNYYFFHFKESPLLIVNTNEIDFVEKEGDLNHLINKILSHKSGIEYYSPLGST